MKKLFLFLILISNIIYADYPATVSWYDYGYAPGKLSMPPTGTGRIDDWHRVWPGYSDMYLVPSSCSTHGQGLSIRCPGNRCSGGFTCRAEYTCPTGETATNRVCPGSPGKNKGSLCKNSQAAIGNPCNSATGNKYQLETDYQSSGTGLAFSRSYNSFEPVDIDLGFGWSHKVAAKLEISATQVVIHQADGRTESFVLTNSLWQGDADTELTLTEDSTGFTLVTDQGITERYDLNGRILSQTNVVGLQTTYSYSSNNQVDTITGPFGHTLGFTYDANNRIDTMVDPNANVYQYQYDGAGNLVKVIYPDTKFKLYHYEDPAWPNALTGITDENGDRYATFAYAADGRAIVTEHAITSNTTPQEHFDLSYDSATQTTVTDPVGTVEVLIFEANLGVKKLVSRINQTDNKGFTRVYDAQNNLTSNTDAEGRITLYGYNTSNQQTSITEASGTGEERTTQIDYLSPDLDLPTLISKPSVVAGQSFQTDIQYNTDHTVKDITLNGYQPDGTVISRMTAFQYNTAGQVTQIDGPLTAVNDITTLSYYQCTTGAQCGQLATVTNALGHSTSYDIYDNNGRVKQTTSPLGVITNYSYDLRGRLTEILQTPPTGQGTTRTTKYSYDATGQLKTLTTPDNIILTYGYDAAHDLRSITDNLGNLLEYRYDIKGNRIESNSRSPNGTLKQTLQKEYDYLNNLKLVIGGEGQITRYDYDFNGNPIAQMDPRHTGNDRTAAKALNPALTNHTITSLYDSLNRLISNVHLQTAEDINNPGTQDSSDDIVTDYTYNALDQLVKVTDPSGLDTAYQYNDLGDLLELNSPDTGITSYGYDEAGNRISQTDAKGILTTYTYDALNRLKTISYPDSSLNVVYSYDKNSNGQNGLGYLTSMQDASGLTQYRYDVFGNLTGKSVQRDTVNQSISYTYNGNDQLTQLTYPSGRRVNYIYDAASRIDSVTTMDTEGNTQSLLANIDYQPFGPINSQDYGNNLTASVDYDLDYRQIDLTTPNVLERSHGIDEASNIVNINDMLNPSQDQTLTYDGLSRLDTAQGIYDSLTYQYDPTSNRIQRTQGSTTDNYNYPIDSHRLQDINSTASYQYDANGNTTQLPNASIQTSLAYGDHNRLTRVNGYSYTYNGQGERGIKDNNAGIIVYYAYDQDGKLLVETDNSGNTLKEYVYANGQLIALIEPTSGTSTPTETILDNPSVNFTDTWPVSTSIAGYQGSNYQYHTGNTISTEPGQLGNPIDNLQASFTDNWTISTSVNQYYAGNYQYHAGSTAGLGTLGSPIDNLQATYTGTWTNSTSVKQYYSGNYQYHAAGTGLNTATWATGVTNSASYDVYVSWTAHANRASNAKYTINHSGGSDTVTVNQLQNGSQWNLLGTFTLDANSTVSLSDNANGYVIADAISILPAGTPPTVTPQSGETATWALNVSNTASYDVYASWTAHPNRASDAKYTIQHSNGSDTITVNQQLQGGQWNLLGTYTLDNISTVNLSSIADGYVIADGITILPAGTSPTVTPSQAETATWTPNQGGEYEIYANWTAHPNRATDAKYTIHHSNGNNTLTVNQQQNGGQWNLLGTFTLNSSSTIALSNDANGYVIADGIRLVSTGSTNPAQAGIFYVHNDHLGTPQVITDDQQAVVWQAYYDPFGKATITTETITNNVRFPGQYYDQETGLHYNLRRYYDPYSGRYITSDPIGLAGGLNTYGYTYQNPVNYIDTDGLIALNPVTGAGGGFVVAGPIGAVIGGLAGGVALYLGIDAVINLYNEEVDIPHPADPNPDRNPKSDKKLSDREAKNLPEHPHDLKGGDATKDLFKDKKGNVFIKPKNGNGFGEPTGINVNNCPL
jgi:RHS repeat-associated protein